MYIPPYEIKIVGDFIKITLLNNENGSTMDLLLDENKTLMFLDELEYNYELLKKR